jgi:hypothetical protein
MNITRIERDNTVSLIIILNSLGVFIRRFTASFERRVKRPFSFISSSEVLIKPPIAALLFQNLFTAGGEVREWIMGEIIQNFAAIHKNIAPRPLSIKLKAGSRGCGGTDSQRTILGHRFEQGKGAGNRDRFDMLLTCLVLTTRRTGIGRNIFNNAFFIIFVIIISPRKNNKKTTRPGFLLGSNVAWGICIKTLRRQERTAENQRSPVHPQNIEHRKPGIADASKAPFRYRAAHLVRRTEARAV